jgi:hypothetical protein
MKRRGFPPLLIVFGVVLLFMSNVAASQEPAISISPNVSSDATAVAPWKAWRVFHESLRFYAHQSSAALNDMLAQRFGLTATERTALLSAGESFVTTIARTESEARAELAARYRPPAPRNPARRVPEFPPEAIFRQPGKTVREMAIESGVYAKFEQRKEALLAAHIRQLEWAIAPPKLALIGEWVQANVRPPADRGIPAPGTEHSNGASRGPNRPDIRER